MRLCCMCTTLNCDSAATAIPKIILLLFPHNLSLNIYDKRQGYNYYVSGIMALIIPAGKVRAQNIYKTKTGLHAHQALIVLVREARAQNTGQRPDCMRIRR